MEIVIVASHECIWNNLQMMGRASVKNAASHPWLAEVHQ